MQHLYPYLSSSLTDLSSELWTLGMRKWLVSRNGHGVEISRAVHEMYDEHVLYTSILDIISSLIYRRDQKEKLQIPASLDAGAVLAGSV